MKRVPASAGILLFLIALTYKFNTIIIMAVIYMTEDGYKKLMEELNRLEGIERPAISRQIAEARDKGDLSENAEYDAAKEAQGLLEMKISQLKTTVANARIIDESKLKTDNVQILSKVKIRNLKSKQEMTYTIVSESEANLKEFKLSVTTPIAKGLLGKKVGEVAEVQTPNGKMEFEIVDISL
jgi:transcription elongation factor GreA